MRYVTRSLALAAAVSAAVLPHQQSIGNSVENELYLLELSPGVTKWATEDEKWELRRAGQNFMDISASGHLYPYIELSEQSKIKYPSTPAYNKTVKKLAKELSEDAMRQHLVTFTAFHTRYYKSSYGVESANWLYDQVKDEIEAAGADKHGATVTKFSHPWGQPSIIAQIPGQSNDTIVLSAHQDSINLFLPSILSAPGADDDGSGTVTILEALRVLLKSDIIAKGKANNTIEFHWYSAEEGGLLGSQAVWEEYASTSRKVKAMLQQDMTGYVSATIAAGEPESVGVITDFVDPALTEFIKTIIDEYCDVPYVLTKCGYACSDHASASKYGYPSSFVIESDFKYSDKKIHTSEDKLEYLSFSHMKQHATMSLAFAYELGNAKF